MHETTAPIGSLGLYIKGNVLLGRVINWTQRELSSRPPREGADFGSSRSSSLRRRPRGGDLLDHEDQDQGVASLSSPSVKHSLIVPSRRPEFKELDFALSKFRTTVSGNFIDAGNQIDGYLASSYAIPHV